MTLPEPEGMLPVTLTKVALLRPFLVDRRRVRLILDHDGIELTGTIVALAVRATRDPRRVVDLVFQEDGVPAGLWTTVPVERILGAEEPPSS